MFVVISFLNFRYRWFKHSCLGKVCKCLRYSFCKSDVISTFLELEGEYIIPLTMFTKKVLLSKCIEVRFVDSYSFCICCNQWTYTQDMLLHIAIELLTTLCVLLLVLTVFYGGLVGRVGETGQNCHFLTTCASFCYCPFYFVHYAVQRKIPLTD